MNLTNLSVGMKIKNYKELCKLLGESEKGGKGKSYQIKDWNRHFDFERSGHEYIITEIHKTPKVKSIENSIYRTYIELLLAYELSQREGYTHDYTRPSLYMILGMTNPNFHYNYYSNQVQSLIEEKNVPKWQVNKFKSRSRKKLYSILASALNSMKSRKLLEYDELRIIVEQIESNEVHRVATYAERKEIQRIERNILEQMGYAKINHIHKDVDRRTYFKKVDSAVNDLHGWNYVYKKLKLIYDHEQMESSIPEIQDELESKIRNYSIELNDTIISFINNQARSLYDKNHELFNAKYFGRSRISNSGDMEITEQEDNKKYPLDFIDNQYWLSEVFLRI